MGEDLMGPHSKGGSFFQPVDPLELAFKADVMCGNWLHDNALAKPVASWQMTNTCVDCKIKSSDHVCKLCHDNIVLKTIQGEPLLCNSCDKPILVEWRSL